MPRVPLLPGRHEKLCRPMQCILLTRELANVHQELSMPGRLCHAAAHVRAYLGTFLSLTQFAAAECFT